MAGESPASWREEQGRHGVSMMSGKRERFGQPLMRVMADVSLSRTARLAYCILTGATNGKTGECRLSISSLAGHLGMRRQNVDCYIKELEYRGIIIRLSKNTQAAKWRVLVGGVVNDLPPQRGKLNGNLPPQRGKLNGNLPPQQGKNLPPTGGTFIKSHTEKAFDSDSDSRVITGEQEKALIAAQEKLDAKRAKQGIKSGQ